MSVRGSLAGLAAVCMAGGSLIVPKVSGAQLADTAATTAVQGHLNSMSNGVKGGMRAVKGARALVQDSKRQVAEGAEVFGDGKTANDASSPSSLAPQDGKPFTVQGVVFTDEVKDGQRVVVLVRGADPQHKEAFAFHITDPNFPKQERGTVVSMTGSVVAHMKDPKTGGMVYALDNGQLVTGAPGQGAGAASQAPPEKPRFDDALRGWSFRGTVEMEGKATGVFVKEKQVHYGSPGDELAGGVHVLSVRDGQARLKVDGQTMDITPW